MIPQLAALIDGRIKRFSGLEKKKTLRGVVTTPFGRRGLTWHQIGNNFVENSKITDIWMTESHFASFVILESPPVQPLTKN